MTTVVIKRGSDRMELQKLVYENEELTDNITCVGVFTPVIVSRDSTNVPSVYEIVVTDSTRAGAYDKLLRQAWADIGVVGK